MRSTERHYRSNGVDALNSSRYVLSVIRTFETILCQAPNCVEALASVATLEAYGELYGRVQRKLLAQLLKGRSWSGDLQKTFYQPFGLTSTHLAHIHKDLRAKMDAATACAVDNAQTFAAKIAANQKQIAKNDKALAAASKNIESAAIKRKALSAKLDAQETRRATAKKASIRAKAAANITKLQIALLDIDTAITMIAAQRHEPKNEFHQHKRRLAILQHKLATAEHHSKKASVCLGTRDLFRAQFNLHENDFASHEQWLATWRATRSNQIFIEGNAVINGGNEFVRGSVNSDGEISLEIRLPPALEHLATAKNPRGLPIIKIDGLSFNHGHEAVIAALSAGRRGDAQRPVTWRFSRRDNGDWTIFVTVHDEMPHAIEHYGAGALGIDLNERHIAVTRASPDGNPLQTWTIPLCTYGKTTDQALDLTRKAAREIVDIAVKHSIPVVSERLDFSAKKATLGLDEGPRRARMLSSLHYATFDEALHRSCQRTGVWHLRTNPAFTSIIGRLKFARRHGLSVHAAAALCIARRAMWQSERLPPAVEGDFTITFDNSGHVALSPLAKMEGDPTTDRRKRRHVWSKWRTVAGRLKVALAARARDSYAARRHHRPAALDGGGNTAPAFEKVGFLSDAGPGLDQRNSLFAIGV